MTEEVIAEAVERDIRIAVWNGAKWQGSPDAVAQSLIRKVMDEPTMVRALEALAHLPNTDLSEERAREVLLQHFGVSDEGILEPILRAMRQYAAGMRGEVERLREALAFYAEREGYDVHPTCPILDDMGSRARTALGDTQ